MKGYQSFEDSQKYIMRTNIIRKMNILGINSFHDLYQKQNLIVAEKLDVTERDEWVEISRTALYKLHKPDTNPELDTLIKLCFLLDLDCKKLFEEEN